MLRELLKEINTADYVAKAALAAKLGKPAVLVEGGFEELVRLGYLVEDAGADCGDLPCGRCPYASMCQKKPLKTWTITDKGKSLLASV